MSDLFIERICHGWLRLSRHAAHVKRYASSLLVAALASALSPVANATEAASNEEEPVTEHDELNAINDSPHCKKNPASARCEALLLVHYCKYAGSSHNAIRCAGGRRDKVEATLNETYSRVLASLRKQALLEPSWENAPRLLVESQRAWVRFREEQCDLVAEHFNGGTLQPALAEDCMAEEAGRRIEALKNVAKLYGVQP